jgi:hypothetical protein
MRQYVYSKLLLLPTALQAAITQGTVIWMYGFFLSFWYLSAVIFLIYTVLLYYNMSSIIHLVLFPYSLCFLLLSYSHVLWVSSLFLYTIFFSPIYHHTADYLYKTSFDVMITLSIAIETRMRILRAVILCIYSASAPCPRPRPVLRDCCSFRLSFP